MTHKGWVPSLLVVMPDSKPVNCLSQDSGQGTSQNDCKNGSCSLGERSASFFSWERCRMNLWSLCPSSNLCFSHPSGGETWAGTKQRMDSVAYHHCKEVFISLNNGAESQNSICSKSSADDNSWGTRWFSTVTSGQFWFHSHSFLFCSPLELEKGS